MASILIVGGTGFLGYHAAREFLSRGHQVSVLGLPPLPAPGLFAPEVQVHLADFNQLEDAQISALLTGHDVLVYAAGADDRVTPKAPAYPFFYQANVVAAARAFRLARLAGVGRGVLLGSYFAYFAREWPQMELTKHHAYIRSRVEQWQACLEASGSDLKLMGLELPYIFGRMPGRIPIWKPLLGYLRSTPWVAYPRGGTNCVAVQHVAEAIVGAAERGEGGQRYLVGDENLSWEELLTRLMAAMGLHKTVHTLPDGVVRAGARLIQLRQRLQGRESGLGLVELVRLQTAQTMFDPEPYRTALGYGGGGLDEALRETVAACS